MSKTYVVTINEFVRAIGLQRQTYYTVYKALWYCRSCEFTILNSNTRIKQKALGLFDSMNNLTGIRMMNLLPLIMMKKKP